VRKKARARESERNLFQDTQIFFNDTDTTEGGVQTKYCFPYAVCQVLSFSDFHSARFFSRSDIFPLPDVGTWRERVIRLFLPFISLEPRVEGYINL